MVLVFKFFLNLRTRTGGYEKKVNNRPDANPKPISNNRGLGTTI